MVSISDVANGSVDDNSAVAKAIRTAAAKEYGDAEDPKVRYAYLTLLQKANNDVIKLEGSKEAMTEDDADNVKVAKQLMDSLSDISRGAIDVDEDDEDEEDHG